MRGKVKDGNGARERDENEVETVGELKGLYMRGFSSIKR
jgi:hypothetical protein